MEVLTEAGVLIFQETPVGPWIWMILLLPAIFAAGALHHLLRPGNPVPRTDGKETMDPRGTGFALGVLLLVSVFLPLPWLAQQTFSGLRFEFDEDAGLVRVSDHRSPDIYVTPFAGFRGLVLSHETKPSDDGGSDTTYELLLARITGPTYSLFRTSDRERILELANRLSHMLRITTVTDLQSALAFVRTAPATAARMPSPAECGGSGSGSFDAGSSGRLEYDQSTAPGFRALRKRASVEGDASSCVLEFPKQVSPLVWPALALAFVALYWLGYLARYRGLSWRFGLGFFGIAIFLFVMGTVLIRSYGATGVVSFAKAPFGSGDATQPIPVVGEIRVWTESAILPGRMLENSLALREVRVVQAQISIHDDHFYLYDRNPLAFQSLAGAFDTARNLKTLELDLGAVPVVDRLRLADILAAGLAW